MRLLTATSNQLVHGIVKDLANGRHLHNSFSRTRCLILENMTLRGLKILRAHDSYCGGGHITRKKRYINGNTFYWQRTMKRRHYYVTFTDGFYGHWQRTCSVGIDWNLLYRPLNLSILFFCSLNTQSLFKPTVAIVVNTLLPDSITSV